tara:strand:+ start:31 stop:426 length:396 start_codon:yes stop_codon:yes gene_type:complete
MTDTIILVDFDGTCVKHEYPNIGSDIGAVPVLKRLVANKNKLILFTMRSNRESERATLKEAEGWFKQNDIPLFGVQVNPTQHHWTDSPKAYGHLIIDDICLGIPLVNEGNGRAHVDWERVELMLFGNNLKE